MLADFLWPFMRISSMFVSIPVFSVRAVPARFRVIAAILITLVVMPVIDSGPKVEIFSYQGVMVTVQQIAIGIITGFILQMVFVVMVVGGQAIAFSMGLGFASMVDPATGVQVPVVAQILVISGSLLFLSLNGHLLLIEMLVDSFKTIPIALDGLQKTDIWTVIAWGSRMYAGGVLLALPIMATVLFVNLCFGVASRAAPQIQIFGVGFPITIVMGMILIWGTISAILDAFSTILTEGYQLVSQVLHF